jgi:predicted dehydrogenase
VNDQRLGVAVIGLGVGEQHARAYASLPSCRLVSVYDLDRSRADRVAAELSTRVAPSQHDLFADPDADVVSIASYDADHYEHLLLALQARKHAFVEKPLCRSQEELATVKAAWQQHGRLHVASNLVLRAAPLYAWLRDAIRGGELGEIYAIDGDYLYGRLQKITDGWRSRIEDYSVMQGGAVHLVDLMLWLTGQRPASVVASGNGISTRGSAFKYCDFVSATYNFPSGMIGRITANFGCVHRHQHVLRLFGTRATFIHDDAGARLHVSRDPQSRATAIELGAEPASKGALVPRFVEDILASTSAGASLQAELDVISSCVAADRSLASGSRVEVAYV